MIEKNIPIRDLYSEQHSVHGPTVAKYMRQIQSDEILDSVRVTICQISRNRLLKDGNHRCVAHLLSGKTHVDATLELCEWRSTSDLSVRCDAKVDVCSCKSDLFGENMILSPDED